MIMKGPAGLETWQNEGQKACDNCPFQLILAYLSQNLIYKIQKENFSVIVVIKKVLWTEYCTMYIVHALWLLMHDFIFLE